MSAMTTIDNKQGLRGRVVRWWSKYRERAAIRAASRARADAEVACLTHETALDAGALSSARLEQPAALNSRLS